MNQLHETYNTKILPQLQKELGIGNALAVPHLTKVTLNTSSREFRTDAELLTKTKSWISEITGQTPKVNRAKKSIAGFALREGDVVGLSVTLRGERMYDFLQKFIHVVLPRTKDFQGVSTTSFDRQGNYTLGLTEQIIFPEVEYDKIGRIQGLEITISSSAKDVESSRSLLTALGMPFAKN
jgi:large subunit ribosomal protein L5